MIFIYSVLIVIIITYFYHNKIRHLRSATNVFMIMNLFQPEKDPEPRDTNLQTKFSSRHLKIKVPSSRSITKVPLSQPLEPALVSTDLLLTNS